MKYVGKTIDLKKYMLYDEISKFVFDYRAIIPENIDSRKNHNRFIFKRAICSDDIHIGEFLASIIGKKCGFKICDTELYKAPLMKPGKFDTGILSYVEESKNDKLLLPKTIIEEYLKHKNENIDINNIADIDLIMEAIFFYLNKNFRPYQEFLNFKQDFIDMMIYDLYYMNYDRNLNNWFIRENDFTGEIDLYPMFDNEMILGFGEEIKENEYLPKEKCEEKDRKITSAIVTPEDVKKGKKDADYNEIFKYILKKYPYQTKKAIEKTRKLTSDDLIEILDSIEGVKQSRKVRTLQLFDIRNEKLTRIYEEYINKEKNAGRE